MSVLENDSAIARKAIQVGRLSLGVTTENTYPIVQIVDGNEQNIGWPIAQPGFIRVDMRPDWQQKKAKN